MKIKKVSHFMMFFKSYKYLFLPMLLFSLVACEEQLLMQGKNTTQELHLDYKEMTKILFKYDPGINYNTFHAQYIRENPYRPFDYAYQYTLPPSKISDLRRQLGNSISKILFIANSTLYADSRASQRIDRYVQDINSGYNCEVMLLTAEGGGPKDIKLLIQQEYSLTGLDGVVLIGRLPAAWFEVPNDHYWWNGGYGYADWTCDLFFMDLDGLWEDIDANGKYDSHSAGTGDMDPEVFVGRIDASTMGAYGTEVDLLCSYLDKNHDYWTGNISLYRCGLVYIDHDWRDYSTYYFRHLYGVNSYDDLKWRDSSDNQVEKFDYLNNRLPYAFYGFTQVWTHATYEFHQFHTGGICYEREVREQMPRSIGYNIDGCHGCDWAAGNGQYFLGGSYIYSDSPSSLVVIGTTKVGGMLGFESFYISLGEDNCIGKAFSDWFYDRLYSSEEAGFIIGWHYGMTVVGDPLIAFLKVPGLTLPGEGMAPPVNFSVERVENRSLFLREYIDVLTWQANPENEQGRVINYRIFEATMDHLNHLADVNGETYQYFQRNVDDRDYRYAIAAVDAEGQESYLAFTTTK